MSDNPARLQLLARLQSLRTHQTAKILSDQIDAHQRAITSVQRLEQQKDREKIAMKRAFSASASSEHLASLMQANSRWQAAQAGRLERNHKTANSAQKQMQDASKTLQRQKLGESYLNKEAANKRIQQARRKADSTIATLPRKPA